MARVIFGDSSRSLTEIPNTDRTAFDYGRAARRGGAYRVLANPASDAEEQEWLAGWDAEDWELRKAQWIQQGTD